MKIAIIGTGNVGATLGQMWAAKGHEIFYGARDPQAEKVQAVLAATGGNSQAGTNEQAASFGEAIVLATPWEVTLEVAAGLGNISGKILVDCTNPLKPGLSGLAIGTETSGGEEVAKVVPQAKVVKCFNTTGANNFSQVNSYGDTPIDIYLCGDDPDAKAIVGQLAQDIGFAVVDCGSLTSARYTEAFGMLWIHLAIKEKLGRDIAFKLCKR